MASPAPQGTTALSSFDVLAEGYQWAESARTAAATLREALIRESAGKTPQELWERLAGAKLKPRERASVALSLALELAPQGDLSKFDDLSGFWNGFESVSSARMMPKALVCFKATLIAMNTLTRMEDPGAFVLAGDLFEALSKSRTGEFVLRKIDPEGEEEWQSVFRSPSSMFDRFKEIQNGGRNLIFEIPPLYALDSGFPIHEDWIASDEEEWVRLDSSGHPVPSGATWAWNLETGWIHPIITSGESRYGGGGVWSR